MICYMGHAIEFAQYMLHKPIKHGWKSLLCVVPTLLFYFDLKSTVMLMLKMITRTLSLQLHNVWFGRRASPAIMVEHWYTDNWYAMVNLDKWLFYSLGRCFVVL